MTDKSNLNDRILSRKAAASDDDPDASDDCGAFGFLRGVKDRAMMLDFRLKSGNRVAFPYSLLERASFDPSEGVTLRFLGVTVKLRGRNLLRDHASGVNLFEAIQRHRVPWILEVDELHGAAKPEEAIVVSKVEILEIK